MGKGSGRRITRGKLKLGQVWRSKKRELKKVKGSGIKTKCILETVLMTCGVLIWVLKLLVCFLLCSSPHPLGSWCPKHCSSEEGTENWALTVPRSATWEVLNPSLSPKSQLLIMSILKITSKIMFAKLMPLYHFSRFNREEIFVCIYIYTYIYSQFTSLYSRN